MCHEEPSGFAGSGVSSLPQLQSALNRHYMIDEARVHAPALRATHRNAAAASIRSLNIVGEPQVSPHRSGRDPRVNELAVALRWCGGGHHHCAKVPSRHFHVLACRDLRLNRDG